MGDDASNRGRTTCGSSSRSQSVPAGSKRSEVRIDPTLLDTTKELELEQKRLLTEAAGTVQTRGRKRTRAPRRRIMKSTASTKDKLAEARRRRRRLVKRVKQDLPSQDRMLRQL